MNIGYMNPQYWPTTNYWAEDYWPLYGSAAAPVSGRSSRRKYLYRLRAGVR